MDRLRSLKQNEFQSGPIQPSRGIYLRDDWLGNFFLRTQAGAVATEGHRAGLDDLSLSIYERMAAVGHRRRFAGDLVVLPRRVMSQDFPWQTDPFSG